MKRSSAWGYLASAFNARPLGMPVPPNWVGLAAFGMLGALNPGFWLIGAGLELSYLLSLANNNRFRRVVDAQKFGDPDEARRTRFQSAFGALGEIERRRYQQFDDRCRAISELQRPDGDQSSGTDLLEDSLGGLRWLYLRLLVSRRTLERVIRESLAPGEGGERPEDRLETLRQRLAEEQMNDDLKRSLEGQAQILEQRVAKRNEARSKLEYVESELTRMQDQVELIREQAALSTDAASLTDKINEVATTLTGTSQWIATQQETLGAADDLWTGPPPNLAPTRAKERQKR